MDDEDDGVSIGGVGGVGFRRRYYHFFKQQLNQYGLRRVVKMAEDGYAKQSVRSKFWGSKRVVSLIIGGELWIWYIY